MADNIARTLSDAAVRNAKAQAKPYKLTDGGGLFLLVNPNGNKLWRYKYRLHGKEQLLAIGGYPDLSLAAARAAHREARSLVAEGQSPVHARQEDRRKAEQEKLREQIGLFSSVMANWRATVEPGMAAASIKQRKYEIERHLIPAFGNKLIHQIRRADLAEFLKRIEAKTPEVARNLRNYLNGVCEFAIGLGLLEANPVPPAQIMKTRSKTPHPYVQAGQLAGFLAALAKSRAEPSTKAAIMLVLLTACRKSEITASRWSEYDLKNKILVIPAERMKARREHWVPLSDQAVAILEQLRETATSDLLFPNHRDPSRPMAERSLNALMGRLGFHAETVHGFRSLFSTHFNSLGANVDVIERCLAHTPKDKIRAAYNRHQYQQERREMLQQWADYIDSAKRPKLAAIPQEDSAAA